MNASSSKAHTISGFDAMPADRTTPRQPTPLPLAPVGGKAVELDCDGGRLSSDAGVLLLKDIDDQLGLTRDLATVLKDPRDPRRIAWRRNRFMCYDLGGERSSFPFPHGL